MALQN